MVQIMLKNIKDKTFAGQMVTTSAPAGNENRPLQEKRSYHSSQKFVSYQICSCLLLYMSLSKQLETQAIHGQANKRKRVYGTESQTLTILKPWKYSMCLIQTSLMQVFLKHLCYYYTPQSLDLNKSAIHHRFAKVTQQQVLICVAANVQIQLMYTLAS